MRTKILDTFVRISKGTRAKLNAHCLRHNFQQGHFADSAILAAVNGGQVKTEPGADGLPRFKNGNGTKRKPAKRK